MAEQVIPEAAVEAHWLVNSDTGWECSGCDWAGEKVRDYWAAHETRPDNDNIPF